MGVKHGRIVFDIRALLRMMRWGLRRSTLGRIFQGSGLALTVLSVAKGDYGFAAVWWLLFWPELSMPLVLPLGWLALRRRMPHVRMAFPRRYVSRDRLWMGYSPPQPGEAPPEAHGRVLPRSTGDWK